MTFDSAKQAASAMGISVEYLYSAKRLGCPNFRNNRVHPRGLPEWLHEKREGIAHDISGRITWVEFTRFNKRLLERARKNLAKIDAALAQQPDVDVLAGLEERIVGLDAVQAAAVVAELRAKLKAA